MNWEMHVAGHLTALGWTTFALYLLAALLSFRAALVSRSRASADLGRVWLWLSCVLAALGLNKPLDLQTLLIELGRQFALKEQLMGHRLDLYLLFFLTFLLACIALGFLILFRCSAPLKQFARQRPLAAAGGVLICAYVLIRAVNIDHVDQMLGFDLKQIPFLWLLETGGLLLIAFQALRGPRGAL